MGSRSRVNGFKSEQVTIITIPLTPIVLNQEKGRWYVTNTGVTLGVVFEETGRLQLVPVALPDDTKPFRQFVFKVRTLPLEKDAEFGLKLQYFDAKTQLQNKEKEIAKTNNEEIMSFPLQLKNIPQTFTSVLEIGIVTGRLLIRSCWLEVWI